MAEHNAATKTIIMNRVTLHVQDPSKSVPFKFDREGRAFVGKHHVDEVPPGQPATLEAEEADYILARHGGREIDPATGEVIREVDGNQHHKRPAR